MKRSTLLRSCMAGVGVLALGGCALMPYDSHYLCEKVDDFGRCTSVEGAYHDAVSGEHPAAHGDSDATASAEAADTSKKADDTDPVLSAPVLTGSRLSYKAAQYKALAGLIDEPVSPILAPPKVLRTLIVSYEDQDTLYMPRFVYFVVDKPRFVLGDYLNNEAPGSSAIYPNGNRKAGAASGAAQNH